MSWTACPRCIGGQVFLVRDLDGDYRACLQCGFREAPRMPTGNEARVSRGHHNNPYLLKGRLLKL